MTVNRLALVTKSGEPERFKAGRWPAFPHTRMCYVYHSKQTWQFRGGG